MADLGLARVSFGSGRHHSHNDRLLIGFNHEDHT
jgi:hypothetical protein